MFKTSAGDDNRSFTAQDIGDDHYPFWASRSQPTNTMKRERLLTTAQVETLTPPVSSRMADRWEIHELNGH